MFWASSCWYRVAANDGLNELLRLHCVRYTAVHITTTFNTVHLLTSSTVSKIMLKFKEHGVHMKEVTNGYKIFVGEIVDVIGG